MPVAPPVRKATLPLKSGTREAQAAEAALAEPPITDSAGAFE